MYVLITWKHSAKTMMHERATDQMIWMSFLANIWYISIKPVGLESFWTEAREQVTSGKESATWKPEVLCIVDITACASKAQPRAWITTYVQTHKVQVCTSQPDRKTAQKICPSWGYSVVCGHQTTLSQLNSTELTQLQLNMVLNISQSHSQA